MTRLKDKALRDLLRDPSRWAAYELSEQSPLLAAEVLELRKVYRAAMVVMSKDVGDPTGWKRLATALGLDKPRGKRAKGKVR